MPIFEYKCQECDNEFERLVFRSDEAGIECPSCSSGHVVKKMSAASVDYQFIAYSGAVHSFTNPESGDDPSRGAADNAMADKRSWEHMQVFFDELFE